VQGKQLQVTVLIRGETVEGSYHLVPCLAGRMQCLEIRRRLHPKWGMNTTTGEAMSVSELQLYRPFGNNSTWLSFSSVRELFTLKNLNLTIRIDCICITDSVIWVVIGLVPVISCKALIRLCK
jgi:hypothetical protein